MDKQVLDREQRIKLAVQKSGRLTEHSLDLLGRCGLKLQRGKDQLLGFGENMPRDVLFVRDDDIPDLVQEDVCDLGLVGFNVLEERRLEMAARGGQPETVPLNRSDVSVSALAEKAVTRLRGQFPKRPFLLGVEPGCASGQIHVDGMLVRRALENVLENAQKYSPSDRPVRTTVRRARCAGGARACSGGSPCAPCSWVATWFWTGVSGREGSVTSTERKPTASAPLNRPW